MNKINIALGLSVLAILALFGFFIVQKPAPAQVPVFTPGAVTSPDIASPYFSYGGVRFWGAHTDSLTQATTTICALQSPAATSTLTSATLNLSVATSVAYFIQMSRATTAFATTTAIGSEIAVGANGQVAIVASSSPATGSVIFSPNTFITVGMRGNSGTFSPTGTCQATWEQMAY